MSSDQRSLDDFGGAGRSKNGLGPGVWAPQNTQQQCRSCGAHVTQQFARVFGDNGDEVHACHNCAMAAALMNGAAADTDYNHRVEEGGHE